MKKSKTGANSQNLLTLKPGKRHGDWVCVLCNNLNYSFRDICNRCKNMTRQENSILVKDQKKNRNPLGELVLNKHSSQKQETQRSYAEDTSIFNSQNTRRYRIADTFATPQEFNCIEPRREKLNTQSEQCKGFSSLLFLTPTRYLRLSQQEQNQHPQSQSPCLLPPMSPLIGALKEEINAEA